jgi:hypothetical protein
MFRLTTCVVLAVVALTAHAGADPQSGKHAHTVATRSCAPASIRDVQLARPAEVDEIRVIVADDSPAAGAATITVEAGPSDRVLSVHGRVSHGLSFHPALQAVSFRVELDPVLAAPASACVARVELRSRGALVATVHP